MKYEQKYGGDDLMYFSAWLQNSHDYKMNSNHSCSIYCILHYLGHSSGGAVASLVFLLLLEIFNIQTEAFLKDHFKCITFGLMPLADKMFKHYVEAIPGVRDCFCHIVQKNDIIPKLFGTFNMIQFQVG